MENLYKFSSREISSTNENGYAELIMKLFKIGNKVFYICNAVTRDNYKYNITIPEEFRPTNTISIRGLVTSAPSALDMRAIYINGDGTIETRFAYSNALILSVGVWETK